MPLPGAQEIRRPLLEAFRGETPRNFSINEILEIIAEYYGLNLSDFSSGDKNILRSRISEAKADLKKHNLLYNPSGNIYMITNAGTEILENGPEIISNEYLKARRKKPLPLSETLGIETPSESQEPENITAPKILPDNEPDLPPKIVTPAEDETTPEFDASQQDDIMLDDDTLQEADIESEAETLTENETTPEFDASQQDDITLDDDTLQEAESASEAETLTDNETTPEFDASQEDDITLGDDTLQEADIESEAETLTENETTPEFDASQENDIMLDDDISQESDIESEAETLTENETTPEFDASQQDDITLDDDTSQEADIESEAETLTENETIPEENLDTEEVQTQTMPEDMTIPEQTQEDLTPETEPEEEYDPEILASAIPSNTIDDVIARYNSELADQLLMKAAGLPSDRFEMLVIDLLSKMGYFAFQTARYTTEAAGSDLIHGVILDNQTGANIYIQARKLSPGRTVGKADIQDFVDELSDKGGKGIFATTANFSENAKVLAADERLMLIDGEKLANLMIANNFCVNVEKVYEIKAIDAESFSEYE